MIIKKVKRDSELFEDLKLSKEKYQQEINSQINKFKNEHHNTIIKFNENNSKLGDCAK
jgi:hypothetical protein